MPGKDEKKMEQVWDTRVMLYDKVVQLNIFLSVS
jgi:hypothetical protein